MKDKIQIALALLVLITGCASHPDKIVFSDEADIRAERADVSPPPAPAKLAQVDETKIDQVVFGYLLDHPFDGLANYSAIFLQTDDMQVKDLIKRFPNHVPPIKPASRAKVARHRKPIDRDTHKPAVILSIDINAPNADGSVDAMGRWYAGDAAAGSHAFHLKKVDGDWQITDVK